MAWFCALEQNFTMPFHVVPRSNGAHGGTHGSLVVRWDDNDGVMACSACAQLDRDERLLEEAVEDCRDSLRLALTPEEREAVEAEEALLAQLLARIIERRAA